MTTLRGSKKKSAAGRKKDIHKKYAEAEWKSVGGYGYVLDRKSIQVEESVMASCAEREGGGGWRRCWITLMMME